MERGFAELMVQNPEMKVTPRGKGIFGDRELQIDLPVNAVNEGGSYTVWQNDQDRSMNINSPFSGNYRYEFDTENGCWMSNKDAHNILELLLRELIVVCNGYPEWR